MESGFSQALALDWTSIPEWSGWPKPTISKLRDAVAGHTQRGNYQKVFANVDQFPELLAWLETQTPTVQETRDVWGKQRSISLPDIAKYIATGGRLSPHPSSHPSTSSASKCDLETSEGEASGDLKRDAKKAKKAAKAEKKAEKETKKEMKKKSHK